MDPVVYLPGVLVVVDEFFKDPAAVRDAALDQDFKTESHKGVGYQGVGRLVKHPAWNLVERAMGFPIEPAEYDGEPTTFYRLGVEGDEATTFIHADLGMDAEYAGVCYLSDPPEGEGPYGTAFWSHPQYGGLMPPDLEQNSLMDLDRQGQDERAWVPSGIVRQKFNRFVAYPTSRFHSRWPRDVVGTDPETGRLIQVFFFNQKRGAGWLR